MKEQTVQREHSMMGLAVTVPTEGFGERSQANRVSNCHSCLWTEAGCIQHESSNAKMIVLIDYSWSEKAQNKHGLIA